MARSCPKLLLASVLAGAAAAAQSPQPAAPPQPAPATQAAPPAPAAPDQPINLDAASTEVDYRTNTLVFRDVVISQGSTRVQAEHARATGLNFANSRWTFEGKVRIDGEQHGALRSDQATVEFRDNRIARATITGKPAEFEQKRNDSDQLARGHADEIVYDVSEGTVRLSEEAWLTDGQNESRDRSWCTTCARSAGRRARRRVPTSACTSPSRRAAHRAPARARRRSRRIASPARTSPPRPSPPRSHERA